MKTSYEIKFIYSNRGKVGSPSRAGLLSENKYWHSAGRSLRNK